MIPLPGGVMSIGAVCRPEYLKQRKGRTAEFLLDTLNQSPGLRQRIERAELISDVRVTGNYSYDSTQMGGTGWVLVGDAFAFLDPVFSSGVYLAMSGAEQAAAAVDTALREPKREKGLLRKPGEAPARRHGTIFILHLPLQWSGDEANVPSTPQHLAAGTGRDLDARGRLVRQPKVLWRLKLFKLVYAIVGLRDWRRWRTEHKYRLAQARSQFTGGNTPLDKV